MYGDDIPESNLLIPLLSNEYLGHHGLCGNLVPAPPSGPFGTYTPWHMTQKTKGATLDEVKDKIIQMITENPVVMKERDLAGRSPLHLICSVHSPGQLEVAKAMCSSKVNINVLDSMHRTPVHHVLNPLNMEYYSENGTGSLLLAMLELLLASGADVNAVDIQGIAPIHAALDFYHTGFPGNLTELPMVITILKKWGADTNKIAHTVAYRPGPAGQIRSSLTPLHLACNMGGKGSKHAIKFLVSPENVNCIDSLGRTPLHTVIRSMCKVPKRRLFVRDMILPPECESVIEKITILMEVGADVNLEDIDGMSPLLTAIELFNYEHSVDIILKLIGGGAYVTRQDRERRTTPLHLVCQNFDRSLPALISHFIDAGALINASDHKLWTPFHYALKKPCCSIDTLRAMVDAGANVKAVDEAGNNCIHFLCNNHQPQFNNVLGFLIDKGCSVNAVNVHGNTPLLHHLQSDYDAESIRAIIEKGADCRVTNGESISPLHLVCRSLAPTKKSRFQIVDMVIRGGAEVNVRDRSLSTPLFYAVKDESTVDEDVVHLLLLAGANPNFANDLGMTPLHVVCSYGNHELAKMLIVFGANVNQVNAEGNTPLHEAASSRRGQPRATCRVLVEAGANIAAQNYRHCTPFLMTSIHSDSYRFLLGHIVLSLEIGKYRLTRNEMNQLNHIRVFNKFYADCLSCVSAMRSYKLGKTTVTLLNFLLASPKECRKMARNPQVLSNLFYIAETCARFRPYNDTIRSKATDCEQFLHFFQRSEQALSKLFPTVNLPLIVSEKIVSSLNEIEMKSLSTAAFGR